MSSTLLKNELLRYISQIKRLVTKILTIKYETWKFDRFWSILSMNKFYNITATKQGSDLLVQFFENHV